MNTPDTNDFPGSESDCERQAIALGNDRVRLRKRLQEGARILYGGKVSDWRFDLASKTLTSPDGLRSVRWEIRRYPDKPIGSDNQQTSVGNVTRV